MTEYGGYTCPACGMYVWGRKHACVGGSTPMPNACLVCGGRGFSLDTGVPCPKCGGGGVIWSRHMKQQRLGWIPDVPDPRDVMYHLTAPAWAPKRRLPPVLSLEDVCPPVWDQGALGSCTGQAVGGAVPIAFLRSKHPQFKPSRLWLYYHARLLEGSVDNDAGAMIRDVIKGCNKFGVCPESLWPYDVNKFTDVPPPNCYAESAKHKAVRYYRLQRDVFEWRQCIVEGFPVVFGFAVLTSFMSREVARTGIAPMPRKDDRVEGGHAVLAVGYDHPKQQFIVRNSWGKRWGQRGYFRLPYGFVETKGLSDDFWTVRLVT